jgi:branched-chain amino acid transport system substrate-binding protein
MATFVMLGIGAGCPGRHGRALAPLDVIASPNAQAEADFRAAKQAWSQGQTDDAYQRFRAFVDVWPSDPLVPMAKLSLGQIELERGQHQNALAWFKGLEKSPDPAVSERARMYGAVARARLGEHLRALSDLTPLVGRTIVPEETALLLMTMAGSQEAVGDKLGALETLDRAERAQLSQAQRDQAQLAATRIIDALEAELELPRAYELLPRDGAPWPQVATRLLRARNEKGDIERVREIADDMREQGLTLDDELLSLVLRAERSSDADPEIVGAILPLSGRGREVGEAALRGIMLAAGVGSDADKPAHTPRIVFRDDEGDPEKAVAALNDLVSLHRVIAVIGPLSAASTPEVAARARTLGIPLITLNAADAESKAQAPVFRLAATPREEAQALTDFALSKGARKFALLCPAGGYCDIMRSAFEKSLASKGATLLPSVSYPATQTSFVKEAAMVEKLQPDAVIIADAAPRVALIAPALNVQGLFADPTTKPAMGRAIPFLITSVGFDASLKQTSRRSLQGAIFATSFDPDAAQAFVEAYRAQWSTDPNLFSALGHDAYRIIQAGLRTGASTREHLGHALLQAEANDAVGASAGFTPQGTPKRAVRLEKLEGQAFVPAIPNG